MSPRRAALAKWVSEHDQDAITDELLKVEELVHQAFNEGLACEIDTWTESKSYRHLRERETAGQLDLIGWALWMKEIDGDLIQLALGGTFDVIVHGCNCLSTMGAGIAQQIKRIFPEAYKADCSNPEGVKSRLGTCSAANVHRGELDLVVVNAYTQFAYGPGVHIDYDALRKCMSVVAERYGDKRIGLPRIGCGLGGGDWNAVRDILEQVFVGCDVTVVHF